MYMIQEATAELRTKSRELSKGLGFSALSFADRWIDYYEITVGTNTNTDAQIQNSKTEITMHKYSTIEGLL